MQTTCQSKCSPQKSTWLKKGSISFMPGLLIALLPKCPFCILSFTSAITLCSSKGLTGYSSHWASWISLFFAVVTLGIVIYNYKGWKTQVALLFILAGSGLIVYSEMITGLLQSYYWGCALLMVGVWFNGNLTYFLRKIFFHRKTVLPHTHA